MVVRDLNLSQYGDVDGHQGGGAESRPGGQPQEDARPSNGAKKGEAAKEVRTFVLGESLPVVPAKLVKRILKGDFVDMSELLKDNMGVERRRALGEEDRGMGSSLMGKVSRREVPDLLSWLQCYGMYAAVVCSQHPEKVKEMWTYQTTMIREARRCGGRGWALYDSAFRHRWRPSQRLIFPVSTSPFTPPRF